MQPAQPAQPANKVAPWAAAPAAVGSDRAGLAGPNATAAAEKAPEPPPPGGPPLGPPPGHPDEAWREDPDYDPFAERVVRLPYS